MSAPLTTPRARLIYSTGSVYSRDVCENFAFAADAGLDGIEIMCDDRWSTRDPQYLQALSETYDMPVLVAHTPFSPRITGWGDPYDQVGRILRTLEFAETLGCEAIVVHLPRKLDWLMLQSNSFRIHLPWASAFARVRDWMTHDLAAVQARTPVKIAVENLPAVKVFGLEIDPTWWNDIASWSRIHDHLTLDTTHCATKRIDPITAYRAAAGRVAHIHLSNFKDGREHALPQTGDLDIGAFLRTLSADGFSGTVSLELRPDALDYQDADAVRRNLRAATDFCRQHLNRSETQREDAR